MSETKTVDWPDRLAYAAAGFAGTVLGLVALVTVWAAIGDVFGWL